MYIRLVVLSLLSLSGLSYAMESNNQADKDQRKIELVEEQVADNQEIKQKLIEANLRKAQRQKEYNALVEEQLSNNQTIDQLIKNKEFDQTVNYIEKVAQENDARPMKINSKKLTRFTKIRGRENIFNK